MKVDLSFLLAPQTESSVPTVPTGDANLFAQAMLSAEVNASVVIPDPSPPDPGPAPNFIGVGEAVPFQPNAEEQEPDLQPQPASSLEGMQVGDFLLAANFAPITNAIMVESAPAKPGFVAQVPSVVTPSIPPLLGLNPESNTLMASPAPVAFNGQIMAPIRDGLPAIETKGVDEKLPVESQPQTPAPKPAMWVLNDGTAPIVTVGTKFEVPGTQILDQQIVSKLNPVAMTVRQATAPDFPAATVSIQDLVAGMRKVDPGTFTVNADRPISSLPGTVAATSTIVNGVPATATNPQEVARGGMPNVNLEKALSSDKNGVSTGITQGAMNAVPVPMLEESNGYLEVAPESTSTGEVPTAQSSFTNAPAKVNETALPLSREVANDVVRQLIERIEEMEVFRPQNQMVMKLNPEHLGAITIVLKTSKGETEAEITSSNEQVHQALDAARPAMQRTLEVKGVNLTSLSLHFSSEGGSSAPHDQPQDAQRAQQLFQHVPVSRVELGQDIETNPYRTESHSLNLVI